MNPATRLNHDTLINLIPTFGIILLTVAVNRSQWGQDFYRWLNANYTPWEINTWWIFGITTVQYWVIGLLFCAFDMNNTLHNLVAKYKIQPQRRITWAEYRQVFYVVAKNQLLMALPLSAATAYISPRPTGLPLPGAWTTTWTYFVCLFFEEAGFFLVHRAVHSKRWYASIHKMHHQFQAPVAMASTYCTLTEHLFSNLLPIIAGLWRCDAHWSLAVMFFASLQIGTLCTHSDYNIPGLYDALQHDWHHYSFTENFGPTGLFDRICGTDKNFQICLKELKRRDVAGWKLSGRTELVDKTQ